MAMQTITPVRAQRIAAENERKKAEREAEKERKAEQLAVEADEAQIAENESALADVERATRRGSWWQRQSAALRARGTTPRNIFETAPMDIHPRPGHESTMENVHFFWDSDIRKTMAPNSIDLDMYTPVDDELMDELGIDVGTDVRSQSGQVKLGTDAYLYAVPKEIWREWKKRTPSAKRTDLAESMAREEANYRARIEAMTKESGIEMDADTGFEGGVAFAEDAHGLEDLQAKARKGLGEGL